MPWSSEGWAANRALSGLVGVAVGTLSALWLGWLVRPVAELRARL